MAEILIWIYLLNASLIVVHEIDSAYWKEWELFRLPGKIGFFLVLHLPLMLIILLGLVWLVRNSPWGLVVSLVLSLAGIFAFSIHGLFIKRGHPEFKTAISRAILIATLIVSLIQLTLSLYVILS